MSKKDDAYYFENFILCAKQSEEAAHFLAEIMQNFEADQLKSQLNQMHAIEHQGDQYKHEMMDKLVKAFITPIEREDIVQLSSNIDDMTDKVEDVLMCMFYNRMNTIRPDSLELIRIVNECYEEVVVLLNEFKDFKHSTTIHEHVVKINTLEEEADRLFIKCMYNLHDTSNDIHEVLAWRDIYRYLEKCTDMAEHVGDVIETVLMKNS